MADLYIAEFAALDSEARGRDVMVGRAPPVTGQVVDFTSGATQSSPFDGKTRFIRFYADTDCHIAFGDDPTATTSAAIKVKADVPEYIGVKPGSRLSVVAAA